MKDMYKLNKDEFALFRKFNNMNERQIRHIDTFVIEPDDDNTEFKMKYNSKTLVRDMKKQIEQYGNILDEIVEKDDENC